MKGVNHRTMGEAITPGVGDGGDGGLRQGEDTDSGGEGEGYMYGLWK